MKVGFFQFNPLRKDVQHNIGEILNTIQDSNFDLLVLPELANSGYLYRNPGELAPYCDSVTHPGVFLSGLIHLCQEKNVCIITGFSEVEGNRLYNSSAVITNEGIISVYRKIHLFNTEKNLYSSGNVGFITSRLGDVTIGMMICFDWIFPESARTLALKGAQIICHPSNLVLPYCQNAMITRSLENRVFTITANRIGEESLGNYKLRFTGCS